MAVSSTLEKIIKNGAFAWENLRSASNSPFNEKIARDFSPAEAADLIGCAKTTILAMEKRGEIAEARRDDRGHRRYSIEDIATIRNAMGRNMGRGPGDDPRVVAFITYKGGVGKSTCAISHAQYQTLKGKRVLFVDCDPQASGTTFFNYIPDQDFEADDTIYRILVPQDRDGTKNRLNPEDIRELIRDTHWGNLQIIPSMLSLYNAEYAMPSEASLKHGSGVSLVQRLARALDVVADDYDVIVLDAPPSLGMISMNVVYAADGIISPIQPGIIDFSSQHQFAQMVKDILDDIGDNLLFFRVLINNYREHHITQSVAATIRSVYGASCLTHMLGHTQEITNAATSFKTVYELDSPIGDSKTHNRARKMLDDVNGEIESLIEQTWPSHRTKGE